MLNQQLADEGNKPIIRKCKRCKVHSSFKDKIWGADLDYKQLISKYNKSFRFLLCVIDLLVSFSKYAWVVLWKIRKVPLLLIYFIVYSF